MSKPLIIGVTGGIGSGKSVVCRLFQLMGLPVYISDDETKQLMVRDEAIRTGLIELLGPEVYLPEGLNKPLLAAYLFASADHAKTINALVHPCVKADFRQWIQKHTDAPLVAIESAILIEAGFRDEVDVVLMVTAPLEVRIQRAMQRDGASRQQVEKRIQRQMTDEAKAALVDYKLINDGEHLLIPQVLQLIAALSKKND